MRGEQAESTRPPYTECRGSSPLRITTLDTTGDLGLSTTIKGIHHVTATVADAQEDLDFYTALLGLRLVKRTVNFDNTGVYHFYYGTETGAPGTIMTTFPYAGKGVRVGEKGAGQITVTSFSVPESSLDFWRERLAKHGVAVRDGRERFGSEVIAFDDPSGLILELIANDADDRPGWTAGGVEAEAAIRGVFSVTLMVNSLEPTQRLLQEVLGFEVVQEEGHRVRFGVAGGGAGQSLDVLYLPEASPAINGIGTVHHVALAVESDEDQLGLQEELRRRGYSVTDVRDRQYFRSIYFREPGGILLEIATTSPGFLVDERADALGRELRVPPWEEGRREEIARALPRIKM